MRGIAANERQRRGVARAHWIHEHPIECGSSVDEVIVALVLPPLVTEAHLPLISTDSRITLLLPRSRSHLAVVRSSADRLQERLQWHACRACQSAR
jgi:hypothetical protein